VPAALDADRVVAVDPDEAEPPDPAQADSSNAPEHASTMARVVAVVRRTCTEVV